MTMTNDVDRFLSGGGGPRAFKFEAIGDTAKGQILEVEVAQQTDFQTGEPKFWKDGKPMEQLVVHLQTDERDGDDDDGKRRVFLKGSKKSTTTSVGALLTALRDAGTTRPEVGATLAVQYTGDGEPAARGLNAPKEFRVQYKAPERTVGLDGDDLI